VWGRFFEFSKNLRIRVFKNQNHGYIYITANLFDFMMMMMMMTNLSYVVTWNCVRVYGVKGEPICLNCLSVGNYLLLCFFFFNQPSLTLSFMVQRSV